MPKLANNPKTKHVRTKTYRGAVRRVLDGESQAGDRDKFATAARLFFQQEKHQRYAHAFRKFLKPQREVEEEE